ncbi:MAG TPA: hypothetical protein VHQ00_15005, partial [Chloroflexota bacterium]|nr:hypothetical protein [Chloroflexota bacterium]
EADAMHLRAAAYQEYNQAAVLDKLLTGMPEVARAFAEALRGVDKITVVSTGDGRTAGASAITGEVAKMVAQMPELFESLTGMRISQLLGRLQDIDGATTTSTGSSAALAPGAPAAAATPAPRVGSANGAPATPDTTIPESGAREP